GDLHQEGLRAQTSPRGHTEQGGEDHGGVVLWIQFSIVETDVVHDQLDLPRIAYEMDDKARQKPTAGHHGDDPPSLKSTQAGGEMFQDDPVYSGDKASNQSEQGPKQKGPAKDKGIETYRLIQYVQVSNEFSSAFEFHRSVIF